MDPSRIAALLAPFLGGALNHAQLSQFSTYLDLLLRWNARINLTAVRHPEQIVARHFGESLFTARSLYSDGWQLTTDNWLLDVGSGAGFPGLPIKLWAPALRLTLIESQHRKATFLREVIRALALPNADVFSGRAEAFTWKTADNPAKVGPGALAGAAPEPAQDHMARAPSPATATTVTLRAVERFDQVLPTAARLLAAAPAHSRRLALLIGAAQVPSACHILPGLSWSDPLPIPQSSHRVLLIGSATGL
jgi:16S rRNA (guanine527-N7)-methyltransferase